MSGPAERIYRRLLGLLPRSLRSEAEAELMEVFGDGWRRAQAEGRRVRFWARVLADLMVTAVAERVSARGTGTGREDVMENGSRTPGIVDDVRAGARRMLRHPGRTLFSAGVLGLGVAATVLMLVLMRDIVLRPLPFDEPDRLVRLREVSEGRCCYWPSFPNVRDWRDQANVLTGVAATAPPNEEPVLLADRAVLALVSGASRGFLSVLGVHPVIGRDFAPDENAPGGAAVAVVSWSFWANDLGSRPLDQDVGFTLGARAYRVVGVLPPDFRFLGYGGAWQDVAVWTPLEATADLGERTSHGYHVVARLAPGVDLDRARAEMDLLATRLKEANGEPTHADQIRVTALLDDVVGPLRRQLRILLFAAVGVLLVACLNLAASLLGQGLGRVRELGIRTALGASRAGLARQMIVESLMTALPACAAGLAAAWGGLSLLRRETIGVLPRLDQVAINGADVAAGIGLAVVAALLAGLIPSLMAATRYAAAGSRGSSAGRESQALWRGFVAGQTALTMTLLVGCGLLIRSFVAASSVDLGYDPADVLSVDVTLPEGLYADQAGRVEFLDRALRDVRALPGVVDAGLGSAQPFETTAMTGTVARAGSDEQVWTMYRYVDDGYFRTLGIPILRGEGVHVTDPEAPDIVIDQVLAAGLWPDGDAIGGALEWPSRVVGVVGTVREWRAEQTRGAIYADWRAFPNRLDHAYFVVRHRGEGAAVATRVRALLAGMDPMVPIAVAPLSSLVADQLADRRVLLLVALAFSIVAAMLAATGVYAVVSFATNRRRREAAIRLSLGARASEVGRRMMAQGVRPALVGVLLGSAATYPVGKALEAQLFEIAPFDPFVLGASAGFLALAAVLASWIPSRRAAKVHPSAALQVE